MIELATKEDLDKVVEIMNSIKEEMREEGNPQWGSTDDDYPSIKKLLDDIENKKMIKLVEENTIRGIISFAKDINGEYDDIENSSREDSYVLHRLAVPREYRKQNIATKLLKYIEETAISNNIYVIKGSTEVSNEKMNRLFIREGFICKGNYSYDDYPGLYNYYEKELERR